MSINDWAAAVARGPFSHRARVGRAIRNAPAVAEVLASDRAGAGCGLVRADAGKVVALNAASAAPARSKFFTVETL